MGNGGVASTQTEIPKGIVETESEQERARESKRERASVRERERERTYAYHVDKVLLEAGLDNMSNLWTPPPQVT